MNTPNGTTWVRAGMAGVLGVICYILAITLPWPETQLGTSMALMVVSAWPVLSIIYSHGLYSYVAVERESTANRLSFIFAVAAFATVLAMIVVQLAVGAGMAEITAGLDEQTSRALRRGLRLIDQGLDVAWDMLIGTALIFSGVAIRRRSGLGMGWAIPSGALGAALIVLNAATFPWPPADRGLFDIGPFIGVFVLVLASRLVFLGRRA
ncbi:MAG TPA: hypothetical protein VFT13_14115 [Candidatus Krumholzibacteria bacterium]|nr:hypothetical protein [Candidatus Krumholzibacteria bacterium]